MTEITFIHPCFHHLFTNSKPVKKRNRNQQKRQVTDEKLLIQTLKNSQWKDLLTDIHGIDMDKDEMHKLSQHIFTKALDLLAYNNQIRLLQELVKFGNKTLFRKVALPASVHLLSRQTPLLTEIDFIELASFRRLEVCFDASLHNIDSLSNTERAGQILFSAIAKGAVFVDWKQKALMKSEPRQWIVESFASWLELKTLKNSSRNKPNDDLSEIDYRRARWFPDPLTELLVLRWFEDFPDMPLLHGSQRAQTALFSFLQKTGISKCDMPASLAIFTTWASHSIALEIPPYMHCIAFDKPLVSHISPESWLRLYIDQPVRKWDSSIVTEDSSIAGKELIRNESGILPLESQKEFIAKIKKLLNSKNGKTWIIKAIDNYLSVECRDADNPAYITWLIAMFVLKLLNSGGLAKKNLTVSSVKRYLGAIHKPLLSAFADIDAAQISGKQWLVLLQDAIDQHSKDQMSRNRIAEFACFIQQLDNNPHFDPNELDGAAIGKRVSANLVSSSEFDRALALIPYGGHAEHMQRLTGALGYYLGLRSGETMHLLLKDIAGEANPELYIRTSRYYGTKNRTSRRMPLKALLPPPLFHEFMRFYHKRMDEEGGSEGNKLLFSYTGNATQPLTYDELITPFMDALKRVTGDQTLVYHTLRHSFANNTLIRLLLPEFPRLRCQSVAMFDHPYFNWKSCNRFRQILLSGTDKDVRTSVRGTLYQLAMLMGHASPETTIKCYLHMFDWIIGRCLSDEFIQYDDVVIKHILKENGKYWYQLKKRLARRAGDALIPTDALLAHRRKKYKDSFANPMMELIEMPVRRGVNVSRYRNIKATDLIQLLPMLFHKEFTIEEISERMNISPDDIIQQKCNAEALATNKTRMNHIRVPLVPSLLNGVYQHKDRALVLKKASELRTNDKHLAFGLRKFTGGSPSNGMEVKHGTIKDTFLYIEFLIKLGVPKSRIILWHYPDPRSDKSKQDRIRKRWSKETGVPLKHILTKPISRSKYSVDSRDWIGWVSVFVCESKSKSLNKSTGIQQALHLLAVFNYGTY